MNIGIYRPSKSPTSVRVYTDNIASLLEKGGARIHSFSGGTPLPREADVLWDPTCFDGRPPFSAIIRSRKPFAATIHGAASFSQTRLDQDKSLLRYFKTVLSNKSKKYAWKRLAGQTWEAITVSEYAKSEICRYLPIGDRPITVAYHGVADIFHPGPDSTSSTDPFILHISAPQPKKNIERILEAFTASRSRQHARLVAVIPGYLRHVDDDRITVIDTPMDHKALARLYRSAALFVFPSLHETFGMPIAEAMSSGCPVITANSTACAEVAGDHGILVDPRSVWEISDAIDRLFFDIELRKKLSREGRLRAQEFDWKKSAAIHLSVFERLRDAAK